MFKTTLIYPLLGMLVFVLFCHSGHAQESKIDSSEMKTLRIDPQSARGAAVSQIFDEVEFIPLETTKESLFGSIAEFDLTDSCYVIFDYDTRGVFIFNRDGKFQGRINASSLPKEENEKEPQNFWGFQLRKEGDRSLIQIQSRKYAIFFDTKGKLVKKVLHKDNKYRGEYTFSNGDQVQQGFRDNKTKDSTYYELAVLRDTVPVATYLPFDVKRYENDQFFGHGGVYDYRVQDELFFLTYYKTNIYKLTPKKLSLAYRIIFPAANTLPADFLSNPVYKGKRQEYFDANRDAIYALSGTYKFGNNLYFKTHSWGGSREKKFAFVYNLDNADLISLGNLEPDSLSHFLPVNDAGSGWDFSNRGFHKYDGTYLYTSYSSLAMFSFKEQSAGKNATYPPKLVSYFKSENKKSNPVLIRLKPKKN
ncbi:6-bladed beta-propeller [Pedobacter faecalis]|uniref:6-bladed beta-propeller n=1 Tax=Pedobacter faecalis TaxID=3041495 RepID=UPI00255121FE|nr:6-bladed beta-propeller [Pedobacter sp. ELA7]